MLTQKSLEDPAPTVQHAWSCPSCGASSTAAYCGRCGERGTDASRGDATRSYVGRMIASLRALASPPGRLTADWVRGRRVGYLAPLSLFLWVNVAFFVVQSATRLGVLTWPLQTHLSDDSIAWITTRLFALRRPGLAEPTDAYRHLLRPRSGPREVAGDRDGAGLCRCARRAGR